jgi:hypothetical protein
MLTILDPFNLSRLTTAELRDRLSQLDPKSATYATEFAKRLDSAMYEGGYMSAGNDPFQTAKNRRICERKINTEFEKARAELGCYLSIRERAESLAAPYDPYSGRSPIVRVDPDEWRAELELIRPKVAPTSMEPPARAAHPTEAEMLDGDRRRYEADGPAKGRVTMRLLRDLLGDAPRSTVSYRLNKLFNSGDISTPLAENLTATEVQTVMRDVGEKPFRNYKRPE